MADMIRVAKAQLWEEAKGKMRAMVAVEGQCRPDDPAHQRQRERWRAASQEVEAFIKHFEDDGLHE